MSTALREQIIIAARENPVLHQVLRLEAYGKCTYEEALQMAVLQLVAIADSQQQTLIEYAVRQPAPVIVLQGEL